MAHLYAGTSGFAYDAWKPDFYPKEVKSKQYLAHYATRLNAVEINYTFRRLVSSSTLENWVRAAKAGKLGEIGKNRQPLTEVEAELARVKRELAITKMERDILKKAAAYFAKESLHGTRR